MTSGVSTGKHDFGATAPQIGKTATYAGLWEDRA